MSAFVVSHACISRVVFALRSAKTEHLQSDPDLVGMMLLDMNRRAFNARYGHNTAEIIKPYRYVEPNGEPALLGHHPIRTQIVCVYKSLRCFVYQCTEGNVPDTPLYLQLEALRDTMAAALGHDGHDGWTRADVKALYDECEWG